MPTTITSATDYTILIGSGETTDRSNVFAVRHHDTMPMNLAFEVTGAGDLVFQSVLISDSVPFKVGSTASGALFAISRGSTTVLEVDASGVVDCSDSRALSFMNVGPTGTRPVATAGAAFWSLSSGSGTWRFGARAGSGWAFVTADPA